ncbi:hypothetical protein CEUSTIGMA_g3517.t1 [Chlamydomonas eustigma]|uniref:CRAL-TRIO domain-containing protein n=1 Tax=Chlamydomonas eustigma TaxID=1157962 RepID=A0A250WZ02_9CHLO|nr:hypothetical protein CEUSTIGMA_g3517.t1 [Chlamydomonas eustigma]|eukprot:GAX76074.1 hypothetical protein CEUSTIGMA_g3517.t1 [Chlamydomonas eustigma]
MPKAPPPSQILKYQGRRDWPLVPGIDDWGLTTEQQESYVEQFRRILESKNAYNEEEHDYFTLRRFLRARTYDLERATAMWLNHLEWEKDFSVNTILQDFYFPERDAFIKSYPQGYHKVDREGRPIYIQQAGKIDIVKLKKICSEDKMIKFHIQEYERCRKVILPICSRLAGHHIDQTFGIMDVTGVGLGHLTGETKRIMAMVTKYDQDNYPEMLGHICIVNAPAVFRMLWNAVKGLIDPRTQSKIEILGTDYKLALLKWVDEENLPTWLGGKSEGSLLDDVGPWSDPELCSRIGVDVEKLRSGQRLAPLLHLGTVQSRRYAAAAAASGHISLPTVNSQRVGSETESTPRIRRHSNNLSTFYSARRYSGVPEELVDEVARKYTLSTSSGSVASLERGSHPEGRAIPTIPEVSQAEANGNLKDAAESRVRTLIQRVTELEQQLPPHMERLRNGVKPREAVTRAEVTTGTSTKSAPEGSLLNRVEVLEEAMETLITAQESALLYQQQLLDAQETAKAAAQESPQEASQAGCCCVM